MAPALPVIPIASQVLGPDEFEEEEEYYVEDSDFSGSENPAYEVKKQTPVKHE